MGVEYRHFLIPRNNTFRPDGAVVLGLIQAWRTHGYVVQPGSTQHAAMNFLQGSRNYAYAAETGASLHTSRGGWPFNWRPFGDGDLCALNEGELIVQWPVTNTLDCGLRHPLGLEGGEDGQYYDLELHFSDDFVTQCNEMIDPMDTLCVCGEELGYSHWPEREIFYASRIRRFCQTCGAPFRPQDRLALFRHGRTGEESDVAGGATYRFAIVIDCGKSWRSAHNDNVDLAATRDFLDISSQALGAALYEIGYYY